MIAFTSSAMMDSLLGRQREIDDFICTQIMNHIICSGLSTFIFIMRCYSRRYNLNSQININFLKELFEIRMNFFDTRRSAKNTSLGLEPAAR